MKSVVNVDSLGILYFVGKGGVSTVIYFLKR